jgi:hypothetical protein
MARRMMIASMWCGCDYDTPWVPMNSTSLEWLFNNASVLLWAEKILVTENDFAVLHKQSYFDDDIDQECARSLFDCLRDEGIIETFAPRIYLNDITSSSIEEQVNQDEQRWGIDTGGPNEEGLYDHNTIRLGEHLFCPPLVKGIYGSLTLARFLNCSCVFDERERFFLEKRFSAINKFPEYCSAGYAAFTTLYQVFLPSLIPERDFQLFCNPSRGSKCVNAKDCRANAKNNLQRMIDYILIARDKPELQQLAQRLELLETKVGPDESRIRRALLRDIRREQRNLRVVYPTVKHWSRLLQLASAPALLYGSQTSQPLIGMSAAGLAALAEAIHVSVDVLQEKHRWLTLIAKAVEDKS